MESHDVLVSVSTFQKQQNETKYIEVDLPFLKGAKKKQTVKILHVPIV